MNAVSVLRSFAIQNACANVRLHRACAALSSQDFGATRVSFFPSIPQTLNHILIVDWYYVDALEEGGKGLRVFESEVPFPELEPLAAAQREVDRRLIAYFEGLADDATLDRVVSMQRRDRIQRERAGDVLMHLMSHQIHHRGQVHAMLSGTPVPPPQLDEFFLREEVALREPELRELGLPIE
jgi:uncharacterized damage-inducible protein DinB